MPSVSGLLHVGYQLLPSAFLFLNPLNSTGNYPEPNKRPLSSTVPTIVEHADGSFYLALGGSGGSKIFPAVAQVLLGIDEWGLDASVAVEWGRVHDQLYPLEVEVDSTIAEEVIQALKNRGHNVTGTFWGDLKKDVMLIRALRSCRH